MEDWVQTFTHHAHRILPPPSVANAVGVSKQRVPPTTATLLTSPNAFGGRSKTSSDAVTNADDTYLFRLDLIGVQALPVPNTLKTGVLSLTSLRCQTRLSFFDGLTRQFYGSTWESGWYPCSLHALSKSDKPASPDKPGDAGKEGNPSALTSPSVSAEGRISVDFGKTVRADRTSATHVLT